MPYSWIERPAARALPGDRVSDNARGRLQACRCECSDPRASERSRARASQFPQHERSECRPRRAKRGTPGRAKRVRLLARCEASASPRREAPNERRVRRRLCEAARGVQAAGQKESATSRRSDRRGDIFRNGTYTIPAGLRTTGSGTTVRRAANSSRWHRRTVQTSINRRTWWRLAGRRGVCASDPGHHFIGRPYSPLRMAHPIRPLPHCIPWIKWAGYGRRRPPSRLTRS